MYHIKVDALGLGPIVYLAGWWGIISADRVAAALALVSDA